jgi:hypothetical protein
MNNKKAPSSESGHRGLLLTLPQSSKKSQVNGRYLANSFTAVKIIPELAEASLRAKTDKGFALWCELRALNCTGSSRLVLRDTLAALVPGVYSLASFYRILKAGNGYFWRIWQADNKHPQVKIELYGLKAVAILLNVQHLSSPREIPADKFIGRQVKRAQLYSSFFKPKQYKTNPISRQTLQDITSIPRTSQKRYDRLAKNHRIANFAVQDDGEGHLSPQVDLVEGKQRQYLKVRRLGNIYHSEAQVCSKGLAKKISSQLRQGSYKKGEGPYVRRFFFCAKSYIKSTKRHQESFILVPPWQRLMQGRLEWCAVA